MKHINQAIFFLSLHFEVMRVSIALILPCTLHLAVWYALVIVNKTYKSSNFHLK